MLETIDAKNFFNAQNDVEGKVLELIRYLVIEAVKHGHELSIAKFHKTSYELNRVNEQKTRMIGLMSISSDPLAVRLSKEILQADFLIQGLASIQMRKGGFS